MDINDNDKPVVSVAKTFDGKLSVRINDIEVYLLPVQHECSIDDIYRCLQRCIGSAIAELPEIEEPELVYPGWM
jgi:hypothetical protein